jgi:hypothetical protein
MVSTCGTSVLTNGSSSEIRKAITEFANQKNPSNVPMDVREKVEEWISNRKSVFRSAESIGDLQKLSAELNSLIRY